MSRHRMRGVEKEEGLPKCNAEHIVRSGFVRDAETLAILYSWHCLLLLVLFTLEEVWISKNQNSAAELLGKKIRWLVATRDSMCAILAALARSSLQE